MKLLMTVDAVGGVWTYALELSRALAHYDVQIVLACMGPQPNPAQLSLAAELPNVSIAHLDAKLEWMQDPWSDVARAGDWLLRLAERQQVDVVHLNGYVHAALPWNRPVIVVAHSCVYSWWQAVHRCDPPGEWQMYRERVAAGLNGADCIVAPTSAFLEAIRGIYCPVTPTRVIYNARSIGANAGPRDRLPVIFASGRAWDRAKGIDLLDAAAQGLAWHCYLAGTLTSPDGTRVQLNSLRHLGTLTTEAHCAWLGRASIFAHPARYEPFGLGVLEAALSGCALVLADVPTLRELWHDAALFVPADDALSLHRALRSLIANRQHVAQLANASWLRARSYRTESMAAQYLALYRELLVRSPQQAREVA
jgi:glycogen(starch) synthase